MSMSENPEYTRNFDDPDMRSGHASIQVWFVDGTSTPKVDVAYPLGRRSRRAEAMPVLREKFESSLGRRFAQERQRRVVELCDDGERLYSTPVHEFVGMPSGGSAQGGGRLAGACPPVLRPRQAGAGTGGRRRTGVEWPPLQDGQRRACAAVRPSIQDLSSAERKSRAMRKWSRHSR